VWGGEKGVSFGGGEKRGGRKPPLKGEFGVLHEILCYPKLTIKEKGRGEEGVPELLEGKRSSDRACPEFDCQKGRGHRRNKKGRRDVFEGERTSLLRGGEKKKEKNPFGLRGQK